MTKDELKKECERLWDVYVQAQKEHRCPKDIKHCENQYFKVLKKYEKLSGKSN